MVRVTPAKNQEEVKDYFDAHGIEMCDGANAVVAIENDSVVGSAVFSLVGTDLTLLSVKYPKKDLYICDLTSRAVMNYGVNRGALYCELGEKAPYAEFVAFGFIKNAEETSVNIIRTFTMCTNCKNNG